MTARPQDVALLPLPQELIDALGEYGCARSDGVSDPVRLHRWQLVVDRIKEHTRANVTAALASAQAREEELRAEVERLRMGVSGDACLHIAIERDQLKARAERLEEALRELFDDYKRLADSGDAGFWKLEDTYAGKKALAALSTNAATQTGETT